MDGNRVLCCGDVEQGKHAVSKFRTGISMKILIENSKTDRLNRLYNSFENQKNIWSVNYTLKKLKFMRAHHIFGEDPNFFYCNGIQV